MPTGPCALSAFTGYRTCSNPMSKPFFIALLLLICPLYTTGAEQPTRVVSTNLCTDQLLLMLAETKQITSVSYLALEPNSSFMAEQAQQHHINHEKAEELLSLKPDLILTSEYSDRALISLMKKLGHQVETFPLPHDIDGINPQYHTHGPTTQTGSTRQTTDPSNESAT